MPENEWDNITRAYGSRAVMSIKATQEEVDAETARQVREVFPLIREFISDRVKRTIDFGAGDGRFVWALDTLCDWLTVYGPSTELRNAFIDKHTMNACDELIAEPGELWSGTYDLVFCWIVLSSPTHDVEATAAQLVDLVRPGGSLVVVDHMEEPKPDQWATRRPEADYMRLFARYGVLMQVLGRERQLDQPITILGGRKA